MDSFFSGLGTEIIILIITVIIGISGGGIIVYKKVIKKNIRQIQKAEGDVKQNQKLSLFINDEKPKNSEGKIIKNILFQKQIAKNNAKQTQMGEIRHE